MHLVRYLQLISGFKRKRKGISANHHSVRARPRLIPLRSAISSSVATLTFKFIPKHRQTLTCSRCTFLTFQISSTWLHENMVFSYRFVHDLRSLTKSDRICPGRIDIEGLKTGLRMTIAKPSLFNVTSRIKKGCTQIMFTAHVANSCDESYGILAAEKGAWRKSCHAPSCTLFKLNLEKWHVETLIIFPNSSQLSFY